MDIKNYLKSIDIDYRTISRKVEELSKKELTESEQAELEELENILKEKEEQITLHRD
ncbi:hypothetical protein M0Q97_09495 [Candidatus Dojkabacteria bacterium]|jgi:hypothetical protein|nr:hypothetical protein [Candidatus Dojkabacteria bacterium]